MCNLNCTVYKTAKGLKTAHTPGGVSRRHRGLVRRKPSKNKQLPYVTGSKKLNWTDIYRRFDTENITVILSV